MLILGIESSCDETALAISRDGREILSNCVLSQIDMHTIYGGVVPEIASRKHIEAITGLADQALKEAGVTRQELDAIAVTYAPGLIGALLVGVNFAKAAALALDVPIVPVHHIRGHIAANYIAFPELRAAFCLSERFWRQYADSGRAGLYRHPNSRFIPGRCGRGVLR